jgi:hypothetical protein
VDAKGLPTFKCEPLLDFGNPHRRPLVTDW